MFSLSCGRASERTGVKSDIRRTFAQSQMQSSEGEASEPAAPDESQANNKQTNEQCAGN